MGNDFDRWNTIKKATDAADETARLYFREGEVWWVRLGKNVGYAASMVIETSHDSTRRLNQSSTTAR